MAGSTVASSLRLVAVVEWVKGTVALLVATGLVTVGPARLQQGLILLANRLHIGREHGPFALLDKRVDIGTLDIVAALCGAYALLRAVQGWGLWHRRRWAEWISLLIVAAYLPLDVLGLLRHPGPVSIVALVVNLAVIALLATTLRRQRRSTASSP